MNCWICRVKAKIHVIGINNKEALDVCNDIFRSFQDFHHPGGWLSWYQFLFPIILPTIFDKTNWAQRLFLVFPICKKNLLLQKKIFNIFTKTHLGLNVLSKIVWKDIFDCWQFNLFFCSYTAADSHFIFVSCHQGKVTWASCTFSPILKCGTRVLGGGRLDDISDYDSMIGNWPSSVHLLSESEGCLFANMVCIRLAAESCRDLFASKTLKEITACHPWNCCFCNRLLKITKDWA